jgi:hypothetical protein
MGNLDNFYDRHRPKAKETMQGVTRIAKVCVCCKQHKLTAGSKNIDVGTNNRAFVCYDCVLEDKHLAL